MLPGVAKQIIPLPCADQGFNSSRVSLFVHAVVFAYLRPCGNLCGPLLS